MGKLPESNSTETVGKIFEMTDNVNFLFTQQALTKLPIYPHFHLFHHIQSVKSSQSHIEIIFKI